MRSLYTDDISGTRSRITIFNKSAFKEKYDRFAKSSQKNPEHKKYEWYVPVKNQRNDSQEYQPRCTLKMISERTGLSNSYHFDQYKKLSQSQLQKTRSPNSQNGSNVLSHSGRYSISEIKAGKQIDRNPYFPHKYEDFNENRVRWTGNREWMYDRPEKVSLPNITKSKLFSYM